jgi:hypothetical protein
LWHIYVNNTSEKHGLPSLNDKWHIEELRGDKYLSFLTITLLGDYCIPHSIANLITSVLMSNEYQAWISHQQGIVVSQPHNKKGPASALEVTLSFAC